MQTTINKGDDFMNIIQINGTTNTSPLKNRQIKYIVIHYTGSSHSEKGQASNTAYMFKSGSVGGSADFIVDDGSMVQYNGDPRNRYCWSVGGNRYSTKYTSLSGSHYGKCTNNNSISIEMCSCKKNRSTLNDMDTDWYISDATLNNAVELTKYLMDKYKIPANNVIMHHMVTGKLCVQPWCLNESRLSGWYDFQKRISNTNEIVDKIIKISINAKIDEYKSKNVKGNNYVEARKFLEALGYQVGFNNEKKRVTVDNKLTLDIPTIIENGFSYIHLRDTIDFLNKYDTWRYPQDKTVTYDSKRDVIVIS